MSRLDELIAELCPDGVEYKTIGELATDIYRGSGITRDQVSEVGTPCVRYGEIYTTYGVWFDSCISHTDESKIANAKYFEHGDILFAITGESVEDIAKSCAYIGDERCLAGGDIVVLKHEQDPKYLSYALSTTSSRMQKSKGKVKSKVVHSSVPAIRAIKVPVPPMEVQHEIVRILDKYMFLTAEITTEITAEITARKKQNEYYRDSLLTFASDIPIRKIGEITRVFSAARVHKNQWTNEGVPFFRSSDVISAFNGEDNARGKAFISKELFELLSKKSGRFEKDDILVTGGGTIGIPYIVPSNDPLYVKDADLLCIKRNKTVKSRFLYHYFLSTRFRNYLRNITHDATIAHYTINQIENTPIPIPPLKVQERLINVLDNFDEICSDLKIRLPEEINARQKQYEYYRDLLLTFAETGGTLATDRQTDRQTDRLK